MSAMDTEDVRSSSQDFTKSKTYAITDLFVKSISALAIVALGVAGWRLQSRDQQTRTAFDEQERTERKYLPTLRGITEVDLILGQISADFVWPKHTKSELTREASLGTHLGYFAGSLFFPKGEECYVNVVTAQDNAAGVAEPHTVRIPAQLAVLMLADLMRLAPFLQPYDKPGVRVKVDNGELVFWSAAEGILDNIALDERTVPAWKQWLPPSGMALHDLYPEVDIDSLASDIHMQLNQVAQELISRNPDVLGPQYIKIRDDVLRSRHELVPH
jgi:hypothetical protein